MRSSIFGLANLSRRGGASAEDILAAERILGSRLPEDYEAFLRESNGAEGFAAPHVYVMLWSTKELVELNSAYSVQEFAPGLVLIGTDGAEVGYGFLRESGGTRYVRVPLIGMSMKSVESGGKTLADLIGRAR